jgi:hypothetical protein
VNNPSLQQRAPAPKPKVGKLHLVGPDASIDSRPRIEPGKYPAICRAAPIYRDPQYRRWICAVQFDILDESQIKTLCRLTWFLNLGKKDKAHASSRGRFWLAWIQATDEAPPRHDRVSGRVFEHRAARVCVEDVRRTQGQVELPERAWHSVIRDVVRWETGEISR